MVKVFEGTPEEFSMDGYLKQNLEIAKKVVKKDWDMVFGVDGPEGSGKSVITQQMAKFVDPTLTVERIVFNADDFKEVVNKASKYQAIILDEAYQGLSSRGAMGSINKALVQMLTVIREKNLFIFIVLPSFFDLDKYAAVWRSRALIHVYTGKNFERGYFCFYNRDRKKTLYIIGKKFYDYSKPPPNFRGRFSNHYTVNEEAYRTKKRATSMNQNNETIITTRTVSKDLKGEIARKLKEEDLGLTQNKIAKILGVTDRTVRNYLSEYDADKTDNRPIDL